jgi:hypothetical protein
MLEVKAHKLKITHLSSVCLSNFLLPSTPKIIQESDLQNLLHFLPFSFQGLQASIIIQYSHSINVTVTSLSMTVSPHRWNDSRWWDIWWDGVSRDLQIINSVTQNSLSCIQNTRFVTMLRYKCIFLNTPIVL